MTRGTASGLPELPNWAAGLLDQARVAHLGIVDAEGAPRVLPVTFAVHEGAVWSAVDDKPKRRAGSELARLRFVRRRPRCALTVDRYDDDWSRLAWVQLLGDVTVVDAEEAPAAVDALVDRYAAYRERRPPGPLLRLVAVRALHWRAAD